jgi:hypothetical protein
VSLRDEYEEQVRALADRAAQMRRDGDDAEAIARAIHAERRALSTAYKDRTPEPQRTQVHNRTVATYGDPLGPTIEQLRARGRSWDEIIESASRPGDFGKVLQT